MVERAPFRASWNAPLPDAIRKSRVDASKMTSRAVLTFPINDLAGDYVSPDGLDWTLHESKPFIDLEHGRSPDIQSHPVAWARETLSKPGAPYAVEYLKLNCAEDGAPPEYHSLPVGTNYFDPACRISTQVFALVEQDALPGVSLEFLPVPGCFKAIGRTTLERRPRLPDPDAAYRFDKAQVVRWTICAKAVNPGAMSILKSAGRQVPTSWERILTDNRVNVGGKWEPLHPYVRKALEAGAETPTKTTVRVETKAMEPDTAADSALQTQNETAVAENMDDKPALGGVSAKYKFAQAIEMAADEYLTDMQSSDSPELRKAAEKFSEMAKALAEKVKALADKHDAKLSGDADTDLDPATGQDSENDSADMSKDDEDGTYKAVRRVYKPILKALRAKRFKMAELASHAEGSEVAKATTPETTQEALERIRREDPEGWKRIQRELNLIHTCS